MVFHKKKQKNVDERNDYADKHGDYWIYIAKKTDTKLNLAHSTGKRVQSPQRLVWFLTMISCT